MLQSRLRSAGTWRRWWLIAAARLWPPSPSALSLSSGSEPSPTLQAVELTRVTSDSGLTAYPALSRDGKLLASASDRAGGIMNIWVQQVAGGEPVRVTDGPADDTEPSFSPDGTVDRFSIGARRWRQSTLFRHSAVSRGASRTRARRPRFSPDGRWIAYWVGDQRQQFAEESDIHRSLLRWRTSPAGLDVLLGRRSIVVARRPAHSCFSVPKTTRSRWPSVRLVGRAGCRRSACRDGRLVSPSQQGRVPGVARTERVDRRFDRVRWVDQSIRDRAEHWPDQSVEHLERASCLESVADRG